MIAPLKSKHKSALAYVMLNAITKMNYISKSSNAQKLEKLPIGWPFDAPVAQTTDSRLKQTDLIIHKNSDSLNKAASIMWSDDGR